MCDDDTEEGGIEFENFFIPFTGTLRVGWGEEGEGEGEGGCVLLPQKEKGGVAGVGDGMVINPAFEAHVRRLESWSLGGEFERAFPGLGGTYKLRRG